MDQIGDVGVVRLLDEPGLDSAIRRVGEAIADARRAGLRKLLVVVGPLDVAAPSVAERVSMVRSWAAEAQGKVRVAMVAPAHLLDKQRLGVVAGLGFGLTSEVFTAEDEALAWLREPA